MIYECMVCHGFGVRSYNDGTGPYMCYACGGSGVFCTVDEPPRQFSQDACRYELRRPNAKLER